MEIHLTINEAQEILDLVNAKLARITESQYKAGLRFDERGMLESIVLKLKGK